MGRPDPFFAYSLVLRTIVFGLIPAFGVFQFVRLRRAVHVFQLEDYKRHQFADWCRRNPKRARFLTKSTEKKPLVMTGRAWRLLATGVALSIVTPLVLPGAAHLILGGWPADVVTWAIVTALLFVATPRLLLLSDALMAPVQQAINGRFDRRARRKLSEIDPLVIGVTGSFGKTSTKFAIAQLVGPPHTVLATPSSYNTPMGVIRSINERLNPGHELFIVEMGARRGGDVKELCDLVHPRFGIVTAVGPAHLESFGSIESIRSTKYELVAALPKEGVAVMNTDDLEVRALADATGRVRVVRYGLAAEGRPDLTARDITPTRSGTRLTVVEKDGEEELKVDTKLLGRHALGHVLAAVAVARLVNRPLAELKVPIESLAPVEHRLQLIEGAGGVTVIDDAYNSNPEGAAAALEVLDALPARRKVVITPGMIELGPYQSEANERLGAHAAQVADTLIVVSRLNRGALVSGARGGTAEVIVVDSLAEAQTAMTGLVAAGDVVLFENDLPDHYEG